ncbi:MAG: hypothetical protein ABIY55_26205, partial [Kofleriaceae bacterium]
MAGTGKTARLRRPRDVLPDARYHAHDVKVTGLSEELMRAGLRGAIVASKRQMGSDRKFRVGERLYRPEEMAARLIVH